MTDAVSTGEATRFRSQATYHLGVHHRDLADQRTDVDEEVEVHVDLLRGHDGVDDDTLARLRVADEQLVALVLLSDERRDVRLETASTDTHNDDRDDEARKRGIGTLDDAGDGGDDKQHMTDHGNCNRDADSLVTTPARVGNVRTEKGNDIDPAHDRHQTFAEDRARANM